MKTILLIEDNEMMRENTAEILELYNYHVLQANNEQLGMELADKNRPDLIICDITMPEINVVEVLEKMNKNALTKKIPFIFLTAHSESPETGNGIKTRVDEYLTKPYQGDELMRVVEKCLHN